MLDIKDFVYTRDNNNIIQSSGYKINSEFLKSCIPLMGSDCNFDKNTSIDKVSDIFKDLVIPSGLLLMHHHPIQYNNYNNVENNEVIDESLYNKLLSYASPNINNLKKTKNKKLNSKTSKLNANKTKKSRKL